MAQKMKPATVVIFWVGLIAVFSLGRFLPQKGHAEADALGDVDISLPRWGANLPQLSVPMNSKTLGAIDVSYGPFISATFYSDWVVQSPLADQPPVDLTVRKPFKGSIFGVHIDDSMQTAMEKVGALSGNSDPSATEVKVVETHDGGSSWNALLLVKYGTTSVNYEFYKGSNSLRLHDTRIETKVLK